MCQARVEVMSHKSTPNIFDRITQMGNSTVTSDNEMRINQFAASLETNSASMAAMKHDLDILCQGQNDLQVKGGNRRKRAQMSDEDDCISTSSQRATLY